MYDGDPEAALMRHHQREEARRRRRNSQREDLFAAARVLIPEHGMAVSLGRIAVHAGLSRHAAQALFNATSDLATALVRAAWHALIEATAPAEGAAPLDFVTRLIIALRDAAPAHLIRQALACGAAAWQREAIADAEFLLARALGEGLRAVRPDLAAQDAPALGRHLLALARAAADAPHAPDAAAEAAVILAMLAPLPARTAPAARPQTTPPRRRSPGSPTPAAARPRPPERRRLPAPLPRGRDPPARVA